MTETISRRNYLLSSAACAALSALYGPANALTTALPATTRDHLQEFEYDEVELGAGPHREQRDHTCDIIMGLNEDSLLKPFRLAAGIPAPGRDLGGWYSTSDVGYYASTIGQWISTLSRNFRATSQVAVKEKADRLVHGLNGTVEASGQFFRSLPSFKYSGGDFTNGLYTYQLLVGGLVDAHVNIGNAEAISVISRLTDGAAPQFATTVPDTVPFNWCAYQAPENMFAAWRQTGDPKYLGLARQWLYDAWYSRLAKGDKDFAGRHAYSHIDALNSAVSAYLALGDQKYLTAAIEGFALLEAQSFATGGWGPNEFLLPRPSRKWCQAISCYTAPGVSNLSESLMQDHAHFETGCGSYAHFKLTRSLLRITKNSLYGDSMERVMYNASLGMLPLKANGAAFYYSDYSKYAQKGYYTAWNGNNEWPCCSGTLGQLSADYGINSYLKDEKGIYVNLYISSTLRWRQAQTTCEINQTGNYPLADGMVFTLTTERPISFSIRFRVPGWAINPVISVNGSAPHRVKAGEFAEITRTWNTGDRIEVSYPKKAQLQPVDAEHPDQVALVLGPMVLFAIGHDLPKFDRASLLSVTRHEPDLPDWIVEGVKFRPWWLIANEVYTAYHDLG